MNDTDEPQRRFAIDALRDDRRSLVTKIVLSGVGLWVVAVVHTLVEYGPLTLGGGLRLLGMALVISAVIWVPVHLWRALRG